MKPFILFLLSILCTFAHVLESKSKLQNESKEYTKLTTSSHIVVLNADQDPDVVVAALDITHQTTKVYYHALKAFAGNYNDSTLELLDAHQAVAYVEQNKPLQRQSAQYNAGYNLAMSSQPPSPPISADKYYYRAGGGKDVTVYVLDSGINVDHEDFDGRAHMAYNAWNTGFEKCVHGTHVAGIVGGRKYGIAKEVSIAGVQVLSCAGYGNVAAVIQGLDWVVSNCTGKCVINLSLGTSSSRSKGSRSVTDAVKQAVLSNIVTVVSAGNFDVDACTAAPASTRMAITVGAVDSNYTRAASNHGRCVDLFAPGVGILSTSNRSNNGSIRMSGTSMAAPHVSGLAAYFLSFLDSNSNATDPKLVARLLKHYALAGLLRDVDDSPNLLANNGWFNGFDDGTQLDMQYKAR